MNFVRKKGRNSNEIFCIVNWAILYVHEIDLKFLKNRSKMKEQQYFSTKNFKTERIVFVRKYRKSKKLRYGYNRIRNLSLLKRERLEQFLPLKRGLPDIQVVFRFLRIICKTLPKFFKLLPFSAIFRQNFLISRKLFGKQQISGKN